MKPNCSTVTHRPEYTCAKKLFATSSFLDTGGKTLRRPTQGTQKLTCNVPVRKKVRTAKELKRQGRKSLRQTKFPLIRLLRPKKQMKCTRLSICWRDTNRLMAFKATWKAFRRSQASTDGVDPGKLNERTHSALEKTNNNNKRGSHEAGFWKKNLN